VILIEIYIIYFLYFYSFLFWPRWEATRRLPLQQSLWMWGGSEKGAEAAFL